MAAHQVKKRTGFRVEYGPVRAADVPEYLRTHRATPEMREVRFDLRDRVVLIPVELVHVILPLLLAVVVLGFAAGWLTAGAAAAAILSGVVLFPVLLPWVPTHNFSTKGLILGGVAALPFVVAGLLRSAVLPWWQQLGWALAYALAMPPVTAYLALNFTGATPLTSRTGVRREIFRYIPLMAWLFGVGIVLTIASSVVRWLGG